MSKFSNIGERIKYNNLTLENETLTTNDLNDIFNNKDVKKNVISLVMENCIFVRAAVNEPITIPDSISKLTKLNTLNLYDSNLEILPGEKNENNESGLYALKHLENLNLTGNPIILNTHNVYLLYNLFLNKKDPDNLRKNAKIGMRITFFKENEQDKRTVIGNLNLVSERFNKSNKPMNQHILLESDFEKLKTMVPPPGPKSSSSSLSSLSSSPSSALSSAPKSSSSSSKASKSSSSKRGGKNKSTRKSKHSTKKSTPK